MTIKQALTAATQIPSMDDMTLEKALIDAELDATATYAKADEKVVDLAAVGILRTLIVSSESEGGYSYNIGADALAARIRFLLDKHGLDNGQPSVRAVSRW